MNGRRRILGTTIGLLWTLAATAALPATHSHARLEAIRGRLKSEATARAERPGRVAFTVLPGDTHVRLAEDLTGTRDTEVALRRMEPALKPGSKIRIPEAMLRPGLSDVRREALVFGRSYPTMWSVARRTNARTPAELGRMARNLQRLNAILYPDRLSPGAKILVPCSLLSPPEEGAPEAEAEAEAEAEEEAAVKESPPKHAPADKASVEKSSAELGRLLEIRRDFRVADVSGLERKVARLPERLRRILNEKELEGCQVGRGEVNLVVVHTTEHRGCSFQNTASYIQRRRLANYLIGPDGSAYEIVPEEYRAYGCGDSLWEGRYGVDLEAINIEIYANTAPGELRETISDAQYEGLKALLADIRARRAAITEARIVTHRMVAMSYKFGIRSRKGDPYEFDWTKLGLSDNSRLVDPDVLAGRAKVCTDFRYTDRVTPGQTEAARMAKRL
jgi:N-acetyl-anhydromuramyl-L-alanine amidase AmpD